ncbi:helicase [Mycobacterium intracellulare]|uniref:helicase n=1 Tax=Mycobacterium intracellulare TaxID=1767 RepID=UPI001CDA4BAF|nr:helicase [Mycobacterium intracellulare]MCA2304872.1 helicase [Mycobacterium intracellulare]MCA2347097.1 helicase [Mycobacterium intracellulare]
MPSGAKARIRANIAALQLLRTLHEAQRPATPAEQRILAGWSGWGAVPQAFDTRNDDLAAERDTLAELLDRDQYRQAQASILNAHYTDPAIAAAVWDALGWAGFSGGRALEPGCGSGTFIAHAPEDAVMVGVESDATTAAVAAALYPSAQIRHEGFETTRVPENSFTAAIGNVPFGRYAVTDPAHNPARHAIHNHFILKSLALTAPGGYVAVLTSRYTLDGAKTSARRDIAAKADLIGAIRLPSKAFARVAGTDVVTDLLILRRRDPSTPHPDELPDWVNTEPIELTDPDSGSTETLHINSYFAANPHHVLGQQQIGHGLNGSPQLVVRGTSGTELAEQLRQHLRPLIDSARQRGLGLTATTADLTDVSADLFDPGLITAADLGEDTPLYTLRYNEATSGIEYWAGHQWQPHKTPQTLLAETRELISLRDVAASLIASQRDGRPPAERDQLRGHLNTLYDNYVRRHGPLNRFSWVYPSVTPQRRAQRLAAAETAWRTAEGTSERPYTGPVPDELAADWDAEASQAPTPYKKRRHLDGGMRHDPGWALVASLEIFDEDTSNAHKAPIFSTDLLTEPPARDTADTPEEALAMCLDRTRRVDVDLIAGLLEVSVDDARDLITGLVYPSLDDPEELVPAVTALSGNVRIKLARALEAAQTNPSYRDYAAALRQVLPPWREADDIRERPGAPWIPASVVAAFAEKTFGTAGVVAEHIGGRWIIDIPGYKRHGRLMTDEWGTDRRGCDAVSLLEAACNSKPVLVNDDDGVLDPQATFAAQAKMTKISEEFTRWLWSDADRRDTLVAEYNRRFNSLRAPVYDGSRMRFPGISDHFTPHFYQRNAAARIIAEPSVLLDHVVGAGKTGSLVLGAMELRRLGLARQPWLVVPNAITEQVGREAQQWYPAAKILLGTAATTADGRRRFIAQTASSDWDLVVIPQSAFTAINVSKDMRIDYIQNQLDTLREQLQSAQADRSKKRIELAIKTAGARLEKLLAAGTKDSGLRFEESGCDYLMIDEADTYKNLGRTCNIEELSCPNASQRAEDLHLKLTALRQRRRDEALAKGIPAHRVVERVATAATGTPISNSLGELWVMQTYLRPDLLEEAGVADLGDWGAAFTATTTTIEVNSTGTKLRPVTRVGKFTNLPALLALSSVYTDVVTRDQVPVELPSLRTGRRQIISLQPDIEVVDFIADLGYRLDHLDSRKPQRDNPLKISNDGRNVSLDPRLAHLPKPAHSRAAAVAEQAMIVHRRHADRAYVHPDTGAPAGTGALQIMFCDRGTPSKDPGRFSVYQAIKDELVARGMPEESIRFIHDVKDNEIQTLFAQCRRGDVSVLIGSTEKIGAGVNVQARTAALYHVDVPWRPRDLEQREGRILRQGNQNLDGVDIFTCVTEGSYDTVMWQKVQAKQLFIEQMRRNEVVDIEIEDLSVGDLGAAAAETKAIATGDPRYVRQVELDDTVKRLTALQRAHQQSVRNRDWQVSILERAIPNKQRDIDQLAPVAEAAAAHAAAGGPPWLTIAETTYTERVPAAQALATVLRAAYTAGKDRGASRFERTGASINGVELLAARDLTHDQLRLRLAIPSRTTDIDALELLSTGAGLASEVSGPKQLGLLRRVENLYTGLPEHHARLQHDRDRDHAALDDFLANPPEPFEHTDELAAKDAELKTLTLELRMAAESPEAKAKAAAAEQRLQARGRKPGWSLMLNPTPALLEELGFPTADALRKTLRARERLTREQHRQQQDLDQPGHDL